MNRIGRLAVAVVLISGGLAFGQPARLPPPAPVPTMPATAVAPAPFVASPAVDEPTDADDFRVWANAAYLLGWVQGDRPPPLVTTSPAGTPRASAGVLGTPGVGVLIGQSVVNSGVRSGVRFEAGGWFDPEQNLGFEAGIFALESASASFPAVSGGDPILARPYFDVVAGAPASSIVALPGVSSGSIVATDSGRNFFGVNADLCQNVTASPLFRVDALLGYQFLRYDERLRITESALPIAAPFTPGTSIFSVDDFSTENIFNGVDLGLRGRFRYEAFSLELLGKVAAGHVQRNVGIVGGQVVSVPGAAPMTNQGGLLALSSNIGPHPSGTWSAVPQFGVNLGWQVTPHVRVYTGYSVLWWLEVARPGDQVDLNVNPALIPPTTATSASPSNPAFTGRTTDLWVQTLSVGAEVKY